METPFEIPPLTPGRRRHFTVIQKRALLAEASAPGGSISAVARKYGIAPNMMFQWRRAMDDAGDEGLPASIMIGKREGLPRKRGEEAQGKNR